jgi:hypothetical protein
LERMKVYYPIKILDATFPTHLHTNGPVINAPVNLKFTEERERERDTIYVHWQKI